MKILRLSLNNLASLAGTHHIHFEDHPLAHAGLIAITGKTGAGKSTLLDAMCLALYNEVPRLRGAAGSLKDAGGQDISIKDSKNILRRGTTSGFAELEFMALDGKCYQARWEIRRARNKVDGNLKVERAITRLSDQRVLNQKISEATPLIEKLIGLSFEQFTRAVLLAQSEVGAFLKAKDNERADLLEYLTNSHIFSLVSIKAAEKYSQVKQQRAELENLVGHIEILSEDEITQLLQQQKELSLQLQNLQQSEKLLENEKKWHLDRDKLYSETQGKKEIYDIQLDAVNKSAEQQQLLEQLDTFQSIREQFVQRARLEPLKFQTQQQHSEFISQFERIQQNVATEKTTLQNLEQEQKQFEKHREEIKPHLDLGLKLDHQINTVSEQYKKQYGEQTQFTTMRLQPLQQQLAQQQLALNNAQAKQQQIIQQLNDSHYLNVFEQEPQSILQRLQEYAQQHQVLATQNPESLKVSVAELEQQLNQYNTQLQRNAEQYQSLEHLDQQIKTLQDTHQQQKTKQLQLNNQVQLLQQLAEKNQEVDQLQAATQTLQQQFHTVQTDEKSLQDHVARKQVEYTQLEYILKQQRLLHTHSVQALREQLKPNEACMVCGSHEHPFAHEYELLEQSLYQLQEQQLQQTEKALEQLNLDHQSKRIEHSKLQTLIEQNQQQIAQHQQQLDQQLKQCIEKLSHLALKINAQSIPVLQETVSTGLKDIEIEIETLKQQIISQQNMLAQWHLQQQQMQTLQLSLQRRVQLEQLITPIITQLPESYALHAPMSWLVKIEQHLQQRIQYLNEQKLLDTQQISQQQALEKIQYQLDSEQQNFTQLSQSVEQLIEQGKDLRQQLAELTENYARKVYRVAADWRNDLELKAQNLVQNIELQRQKTTHAETQLHQANLKLQAFVTQLKQMDQQLEQHQQQIQTWQLAHPHVTSTLIEQWLRIDLAEHQRIRQNLNNQQQLLEKAKAEWHLLEEQYQAHLKLQQEQDFATIENKLTQLNEDKMSQQAAFNELDAKLRMNANNQATYAKYQTQIEQIKAEEYRWGRIYDLIGHKEGTKFQKIAQEHHLDILVEYANQQLQPLAPRYQLHRIPDSLSLAIIDLDMNSEIRPVLSLSGGETFLVSLALALAIANMASGSMKLESLFIDEGFGTLDPASLHMVMNALDHLQSQGRKIVLISHVQEMHERIPVQIQVKPLGAGASTIQVVG